MAKNKGVRFLITLECGECRLSISKRSQGVSRFFTQKNRRNNPERLQLNKYCSYCNKATLYTELK